MSIPIIRRAKATLTAARSMWGAIGRDQNMVLIEANQLRELEEEMYGFRQAGGSTVDMDSWDHTRMLKEVLGLYRKNPMAGRVLDIIVDFVVGDGIGCQADHEKESAAEQVQEVIDAFWDDPINAMDRTMEEKCREQNLWGEICITVRRNPFTGRTRHGWVTPSAIAKVVPDPMTGRPGTVVLEDMAGDQVGTKQLDIIRYHDEIGALEGNCFFAPINTLRGAQRGVSELYSLADWFKVLDQTMRAQADRAKFLNYFLWTVKLNGLNDDEVRAWQKKNGAPPKPNSVRAHNDAAEWDVKAPNLGAADFSQHIHNLKSHILGSRGIPNHWFGSGDDANLATAAVMSEPTRKALRRKQRQFKWLLTDMVRFELHSVKQAGKQLQGVDLSNDPFKVQIPDLAGPDIAKVASAVAVLTSAIAMAEDRSYITQETAGAMFAAISSETGFEIDPTTEFEKVKKDIEGQLKKEKDEEDKKEDDLQSRLRVAQNEEKAAGA